MGIRLQAAFDLESDSYSMKLGERAVHVPPLSLGRFLNLMGCDFLAVSRALLAGLPEKVEAAATPPKDAAELVRHVARQLAYIDHEALAEVIAAVCPGVTVREWKEHGSALELTSLNSFFGRVHDWPFLLEAIAFGKPREPDEEPTTRNTMNAALVSLARATGYTIEQLLSMRVEGFFHLKAGVVALAHPEEQLTDPAAFGVVATSDPEKKSPLWAAMEEAEKGGSS